MKKEHGILVSGIAGCGLLYLLFAYLEITLVGYALCLAAAGVYLYLLLNTVKKKIESQREYKIMAGVLAYLFLINIAYGTLQITQAHYQGEMMSEIRETIDTSIISAELHESMIKTLKIYHQQDSTDLKTIVQVFEETMGGKLKNDGTIQLDDYSEEETAFFAFYDYPDEQEVSIIAVTAVSKGEDPGFENHNSDTGKIQLEASLTRGGIEYERTN